MTNVDYFGGISVYPTPDSLQSKIDEYFSYCFRLGINRQTGLEEIIEVHTPSYSGLARWLGFSSRAQFLNYKNSSNEAFERVISRGKLRIEEYLEGKLVYSKAPSGIMFSLKNNAGWEEKTKQQITGEDDKPLVFTWDTGATDVIDIQGESAQKETPLPMGTPKIAGSIAAHD